MVSIMSYIAFNELQTQLLLALTVLFASWLILRYIKIPKNLPSGPWGLPFIGYKLFLGPKPHITVANMRENYGDVIRINLGTEEVIFLTSYKAIKEALLKQNDIFAGRPEQHFVPELKSRPGIIRSSGEIWADLRRFSLSKLKDFGFGKASLEPRIKDEIFYFLKKVEVYKGQPIPDIGELIRKSITNVICIVMTGKRFDYDDKPFLHLLKLSHDHLHRLGIDRFISLIPRRLRFKILLKALGIKSSQDTALEMIEVISKIVDRFEEKYEAESEDNFIDAWLTESLKTQTKSKYLTKYQLPTVLFDLFLAGSDTTTNTLGWSLLYMIEHPDIQDKAHKEIDDVIGRERTPSMSDQKLMPYTEAILMEVSRIVTIVPLSLLHSNQTDTTVLEKFIPKGTSIIPNLWAAHHDPEIFPEPHKFKPERFLSDDGQIKRVEEYLPFSIGKRQCMGESLARMELFLYFTSMLQHFTFKKVNETVNFDYDYAVISMPKVQPISAVPRL